MLTMGKIIKGVAAPCEGVGEFIGPGDVLLLDEILDLRQTDEFLLEYFAKDLAVVLKGRLGKSHVTLVVRLLVDGVEDLPHYDIVLVPGEPFLGKHLLEVRVLRKYFGDPVRSEAVAGGKFLLGRIEFGLCSLYPPTLFRAQRNDKGEHEEVEVPSRLAAGIKF